jgi:hypothetical protein
MLSGVVRMAQGRVEFPVEIRLNPIQSVDGILVLAAIVEITECNQAESELVQKRNELTHLGRVTTGDGQETNQNINSKKSTDELMNWTEDVDPVKTLLYSGNGFCRTSGLSLERGMRGFQKTCKNRNHSQ